MNSLSAKLKAVIIERLQVAGSDEILEITSQLCAAEQPVAFTFKKPIAQRFVKLSATDEAQSDDCPEWVAVEDTSTGLIWSRDDVGERHTWEDAKKAAAKVKLLDLSGWRLPTIKELLSLVDYDKHSPAIDKTFFPSCKADWYWTSTPYASSPGDYAWFVGFYYGYSYCHGQDSGGLVRAVRSRQ